MFNHALIQITCVVEQISLFIGQRFKTFKKSVTQNGCLMDFLTAWLHRSNLPITVDYQNRGLESIVKSRISFKLL